MQSYTHHNRCYQRILKVLLCGLLLCLALHPLQAKAATSQELQAQLDEANKQLDSMIAQTQTASAELEETQSALEETQRLIDDTLQKLENGAIEVERNQSDLAAIVSSDYKTHGTLGLLSFILGATSYDDFVSRMYYVERITIQKDKALSDLRASQDELTATREDLEAKSSELLDLAAQQKSQVDDLQSNVAAQQAYVSGLPAEIQSAIEAERAEELEAAEKEAEDLIASASDEETSGTETETPQQEETPQENTEDNTATETPSDSNTNTSSNTNTTPKTPEPTGGSLADVANYIGPQASWSNDADYIASQQRLLKSAGSATSWGCVVDKGTGRCVVFRNDGGVWKAAMTTNVLTNWHTFTGTFKVELHARWLWQDGYDINDWWVCFIAAWSSNNRNGHLRYVEGKGYDNGQGFHYGYSTGGCTVISNKSTAQWLYDHVPDGSRVIVH